MSSFILVTPSKHIADSIQQELTPEKVRFRHVSDLNHARKWFQLNPAVKGIFADQCFSPELLISFFIECWNTSPELLCAIVSADEVKEEYLPSLTLGVEECCGYDFPKKTARRIERIPKAISITGVRQHTAILVVEDLDSPRDIICSLIESLGYSEVTGVSSVEEAMEVLEASPFHFFAVVTDLNMPRESGHQLIVKIRNSLTLAYLPIIVLTSDPSEENLLNTIRAGVSGFIAKPPKRDLLRAELEKAKRLVLLGRSPEIGTPEEIRLLEEILRKRSHASDS